MTDIKKVLVSPMHSIIEVIKIIDQSALQIALVVDKNMRLLGTVTDGDIRRGILKGIALEQPVKEVMKSKPVVANVEQSTESILRLMKIKVINQVPIVDNEGRVVRLELLNELIEDKNIDNWVVLMAGGLGSRLKPLTDDCPKPMVSIGGKPLLETILENFIEQGFNQFYFAVNHMAEQITGYFGDGSKWDININYLLEKKKLGTAGAISLLHEQPTKPIIVMNGDLLTKVNYNLLLEFHKDHKAAATMCVREHSFQIPYGVIKIDDSLIKEINEKPVQRCFVNAGIYVLEPEALQFIPKNEYLDMTTLFETLIANNMETTVYPIREYWIDIGQHDALEKANNDYRVVFEDD